MARFHTQKASLHGSGAPTAVTPEFIGQIYVDTDGSNYYYSTGTDEGDWSLVAEPEVHALDGAKHEGSGGVENEIATFDANGKLQSSGQAIDQFQALDADWIPKVYNSSGEPTLTGTLKMAFWESIDDNHRIYFIVKRTDSTQMLIELT